MTTIPGPVSTIRRCPCIAPSTCRDWEVEEHESMSLSKDRAHDMPAIRRNNGGRIVPGSQAAPKALRSGTSSTWITAFGGRSQRYKPRRGSEEQPPPIRRPGRVHFGGSRFVARRGSPRSRGSCRSWGFQARRREEGDPLSVRRPARTCGPAGWERELQSLRPVHAASPRVLPGRRCTRPELTSLENAAPQAERPEREATDFSDRLSKRTSSPFSWTPTAKPFAVAARDGVPKLMGPRSTALAPLGPSEGPPLVP